MSMETAFDIAFRKLIGHEGGYVDDPRDPGGETKYGICKRDWPAEDIANLTIERAKAIYKDAYWLAAHCDRLDWPLAALVFDSAVNQGVPVAVKLLQKAVGTVQDGVLGQNTLRAIAAKEQTELCAMYMADRALRYTGTRNFDTYGRGWFKRLFKLTAELSKGG